MDRRTLAIASLFGLLLLTFVLLALPSRSRGQTVTEPSAPPGPRLAMLAGPTIVPVMIRLSGGDFEMGCADNDANCWADEKPRHRVTLPSFSLSGHLVAVSEYQACVAAGACPTPQGAGEYFNWEAAGRERHPINGVDWSAATDYCAWLGKRLPTEAELEFAMRNGRNDAIYPWGDGDAPPANFANLADESAKRVFPFWKILEGYDDGYVGTSPVCSFDRDAFGLCDMSGNVWEWTADWYDPNYYAASPAQNPKGPDSGLTRVLRGGSWQSAPVDDRASRRLNRPPVDSYYDVGFRCAGD